MTRRSVTIVGVVADARINGLKDDAAMMYLPYWAYTPYSLAFLVRGSQPGEALIPEMRRAIWQVDPQVAIPLLKLLDDQVGESAATERFPGTGVLTSFGIAALLLSLCWEFTASYGLFRDLGERQEFGIRMALGLGQESPFDRFGAEPGIIPGSAGSRSRPGDGVLGAALGEIVFLPGCGRGSMGRGRQRRPDSGGGNAGGNPPRTAGCFHRSHSRLAGGLGAGEIVRRNCRLPDFVCVR